MHTVPPQIGITPDCWVVLETNQQGTVFQKLLSGWSGGYLDGNTWRLSSTILEFEVFDNDIIIAKTQSGSEYRLHPKNQQLGLSIAGVYQQMKDRFGETISIVKV